MTKRELSITIGPLRGVHFVFPPSSFRGRRVWPGASYDIYCLVVSVTLLLCDVLLLWRLRYVEFPSTCSVWQLSCVAIVNFLSLTPFWHVISLPPVDSLCVIIVCYGGWCYLRADCCRRSHITSKDRPEAWSTSSQGETPIFGCSGMPLSVKVRLSGRRPFWRLRRFVLFFFLSLQLGWLTCYRKSESKLNGWLFETLIFDTFALPPCPGIKSTENYGRRENLTGFRRESLNRTIWRIGDGRDSGNSSMNRTVLGLFHSTRTWQLIVERISVEEDTKWESSVMVPLRKAFSYKCQKPIWMREHFWLRILLANLSSLFLIGLSSVH